MKSKKVSPIYLFQFEYLNRNELKPEYCEFYLLKIQYTLLRMPCYVKSFEMKIVLILRIFDMIFYLLRCLWQILGNNVEPEYHESNS